MITRFLWNGMSRNLRLFVLLVLAIGIVLPLLNQLMPKGSPFYVPKADTPVARAVEMIADAGGVSVFAHPLARKRGRVVEPSVIADLSAAANLSLVDYSGDVPWDDHPLTKEWYVRVKSRPSFRCLLRDVIQGVPASRVYADLDF